MTCSYCKEEGLKSRVYPDGPGTTTLVHNPSFYDEDGNRHYQMIQDWVAQGNTISPYVAPTVPPQTDKEKIEQKLGLSIAEIKMAMNAP